MIKHCEMVISYMLVRQWCHYIYFETNIQIALQMYSNISKYEYLLNRYSFESYIWHLEVLGKTHNRFNPT